MLKRSILFFSVLLCSIICINIVYLLLNPKLIDFVFSKPLYCYSILLFFVSFAFVIIIVYKSTFFSPSMFLFIFFMAVPLLGALKANQYFDEASFYFGRSMPSFDFPTFLWSVGTVSFFGGVLLGWFLLPKSKRNTLILWDHRRIVLLLGISVVLATLGTMLAFFRIGYIPLLRSDILDVRFDYAKTVGSFALKFSQHWLVPAILSSILFFIEKGNKKYMYLCIMIFCAMGSMFYAQRTGLVWIISAFGLMYFKFSRPRLLRLLAAAGIALVLVCGMMIQAEYRTGLHAADSESRIAKYGFFEWSQYSIVVNEARSESKYLGWKIYVGPFFTLFPSQIYTLLGYDKGALIIKYSAVFHYGREFEELYGIRVTPIGEAFAAYGFCGVILQMLFLGLLFAALERKYLGLDKCDARLCVVCYGLSLMLHLPITTMFMLLGPLSATGVFVVVYYYYGTRNSRLSMYRSGIEYIHSQCNVERSERVRSTDWILPGRSAHE